MSRKAVTIAFANPLFFGTPCIGNFCLPQSKISKMVGSDFDYHGAWQSNNNLIGFDINQYVSYQFDTFLRPNTFHLVHIIAPQENAQINKLILVNFKSFQNTGQKDLFNRQFSCFR